MRYTAAILLTTLTGCAPDDVKELPDVKSVQVVGDTATVNALIDMLSEERYVTQAAYVVKDASELMRDNAAYSKVQRVHFQFYAVTLDRLGKEGEVRTFTATFPMADLRAADFQNLYGAKPMNLASQVTGTREGLRLIAATCSEPERLEDAMEFCRKALAAR